MKNAVSILTILQAIYQATVRTALGVCVCVSLIHTSRRQINIGALLHWGISHLCIFC